MTQKNNQAAGDGQEQSQQQAQAADTGSQQASGSQAESGQAPAQQPKTYDEAYVQKLRQEAAENRTKLKALEDREKSELQKAQDQLKEKETQLQNYQREQRALRVQVLANKHGIIDPEAAAALLPSDTPDDGIEQGLLNLKAAKPWLVAQPGAASAGNSTNPQRTPPSSLTKEQIARMTPAEINANWDQVQQVLAQK